MTALIVNGEVLETVEHRYVYEIKRFTRAKNCSRMKVCRKMDGRYPVEFEF